MTATLYLIRHAAHGQLGAILSGRTPGLSLSETGRDQAAGLSRALAGRVFAGIWSSPVERARQTADALVAGRGMEVEVAPALDEIDFGAWAGQSFAALDADPDWHEWNSARDRARTPGGETMAAAQTRVVAFAEQLARAHAGRAVALVSHCDVIRAALCHWLGLSLDRALAFDVDPASVSRVAIGDGHARVLSINESLA